MLEFKLVVILAGSEYDDAQGRVSHTEVHLDEALLFHLVVSSFLW